MGIPKKLVNTGAHRKPNMFINRLSARGLSTFFGDSQAVERAALDMTITSSNLPSTCRLEDDSLLIVKAVFRKDYAFVAK